MKSIPILTQNKITNSERDSITNLDEVIIKANTIFGNKFVAQNRTGSSYYLSNEELSNFNHIDINRVLEKVPGINIYEEDGFGLRPNISLRGTSPERSSKITLMEDGVLIAPAPYSASSAYYFPSVARMEAVEILKGSSQIQYGPYTTGGAINFVTSNIPDELKGRIKTSYGSFNSGQTFASFGNTHNQFGYLIESLNYNSNGFKTLGDDLNTGFDINELVTKIRFSSSENDLLNQSIELKFQYYDEVSNETYLGLTDSDYLIDPYQRYAASEKDKMNSTHIQYLLTHILNFSSSLKIVSKVYYNGFKRNWYKIDDVVFDDKKKKISEIISSPNLFFGHYSIISGKSDGDSDALRVKANNREYYSKGVQAKVDYHWYGKNESFHDLEIGSRIHYDQEDRFQWEDGYSIIKGYMALSSNGLHGDEGNRINSAKSFATYIMYKYKFKGLTLTPGIRHESIILERKDFGKINPNRNDGQVTNQKNKVSVFIPGIGFNYSLNKVFSFFGGVHKGFSPPGNSQEEKPEESINIELGTRFSIGRLKGELISFLNDYSNLLGSDLSASGGFGELDQFNAGEAFVNGLELLLNFNLIKNDKIQIPVSLAYTLTNAKFQSDFGSTQNIWGKVKKGDRIPYIPKHQLNSSISILIKQFEVNLSANYNGKYGTLAGGGNLNNTNEINSNFIFDLSSKFKINKNFSITAKIINLFNREYSVSRVPAGLRPGHPFGIYGGIEYSFKANKN
jgi:Fe(3+) dicitrate transport protein